VTGAFGEDNNQGWSMKLAMWTNFCVPAALLAVSSLNASATTCASVNGSSISALNALGSAGCTIGDLTFSNFFFNYSGAVTPNPSTQVAVDFAEITDGFTQDTFGTTGSTETPLYTLTANYSGGNTVGENQTAQYLVQYLVTDNVTGMTIIQVDDAIFGTLQNSGTAGLTGKFLCAGGQFVQSGGVPSSVCSQGAGSRYQAVANGGLSLQLNGGSSDIESDSSINYSGPNNSHFDGSTIAGGSSNFGVYDQVNLNGGSTAGSSASVTAVQNDFVEVAGAVSATPEPRAIVLLGGALIGFAALYRIKKLA
jgi:hypothetical protein